MSWWKDEVVALDSWWFPWSLVIVTLQSLKLDPRVGLLDHFRGHICSFLKVRRWISIVHTFWRSVLRSCFVLLREADDLLLQLQRGLDLNNWALRRNVCDLASALYNFIFLLRALRHDRIENHHLLIIPLNHLFLLDGVKKRRLNWAILTGHIANLNSAYTDLVSLF